MSILKGEPLDTNLIFDDFTYDSKNITLNENPLAISKKGKKLYTLDVDEILRQYTVSDISDISTATYDNVSYNFSSLGSFGRDIFITEDGTKMFYTDTGSDSIFEHDLSNPYDISSMTYTGRNFNYSSQDAQPHSSFFNNDGSKMFMIGLNTNRIYEYNLSTPYNLSTVSYSGKSFTGQGNDYWKMHITKNGNQLLILDNNSNIIYKYVFSNPFDVSSLSYSNQFYSPTLSSEISTFFLTKDDKKFYYIDENSNVKQFSTNIAQPAIQNIYYGQPTNYLSFDGIDDYIDFNSDLSINQFPFTYNIEVEFTDLVNNERPTLIDGLPNQYTTLAVTYRHDLGFFELRYGDENGTGPSNRRSYLYDFNGQENVIYNIEVFSDGFNNVPTLIVNGNNIANTSSSGSASSNVFHNEIILGQRADFNSLYTFKGNMYYFSVEVNGNLVHEYLFNEGSGTTLNDSAGNNDGTIVGATWGSEPNEVSRVYLGETLVYSTQLNYSLTFLEDTYSDILSEGIDDQVPSSNYHSTNFIQLQNNSLIIDQSSKDYITYIVWLDSNNDYIGWTGESGYQGGNSSIISAKLANDLEHIPTNGDKFSIVARSTPSTSWDPNNISFTDFQTIIVSY